jgi:integration host factor subunit alpha
MMTYKLTNTFIDKLQAIDKGLEYTDFKIKYLKLRVPKLTKKDPGNLTKVFYLYYRINGRKRKYKIGNFGEIGLTEARKSAEKLLAQIVLGKEFVESFFTKINNTLISGEEVKLTGFGNFSLRGKKERPGRNSKTGEEVVIKARRVVIFNAGSKLRLRVEESSATTNS